MKSQGEAVCDDVTAEGVVCQLKATDVCVADIDPECLDLAGWAADRLGQARTIRLCRASMDGGLRLVGSQPLGTRRCAGIGGLGGMKLFTGLVLLATVFGLPERASCWPRSPPARPPTAKCTAPRGISGLSGSRRTPSEGLSLDSASGSLEAHWRYARPARAYVCGVAVGLGAGVVMMAGLTHLGLIQPGWTPIMILAFALIAIGSCLASHPQRRCDRGTAN